MRGFSPTLAASILAALVGDGPISRTSHQIGPGVRSYPEANHYGVVRPARHGEVFVPPPVRYTDEAALKRAVRRAQRYAASRRAEGGTMPAHIRRTVLMIGGYDG